MAHDPIMILIVYLANVLSAQAFSIVLIGVLKLSAGSLPVLEKLNKILSQVAIA